MPTKTTRRELLASAGAFAMPAIVAEGVIARKGRPGANDKIVIANIGVGGMGSNHIYPNSAALCDVDVTRLAAAAKKVTEGTPMLVTDYRRILDRKDIDAVTNGTPDHWHALIAIHACQAGKHVYSEKPTARTLAEGRAMVNAARRHNRVVQIGAQGRSNPNAHKACEYVRNGQLGTVRRVEIWHPDNPVSALGPGKYEIPKGLNWDMWVGPAKWREYHPAYHPGSFRWFMDLGGGQIRDRGNHAISMVCWLMNHDNYRGLVTVEATGQKQTSGVYDVPLNFEVKYQFYNPDWTLYWSQKAVPSTHGLWGATYWGDRDSLILTQGDGAAGTEEKAMRYTPPTGGEVFIQPAPERTNVTERHRMNWLDCIKTGKRPAMDVEIGYRTVTYCILGNMAWALGRKLTFDTNTERFVNDKEANELIDVPYRAPWKLG
jgi:predicted dehydrogenase